MPQTDLPQTEEFVRSSSSESSGSLAGSLEHHQSNLSISSVSSRESAANIRYAELPVFEPLTFPREPSLDELLVITITKINLFMNLTYTYTKLTIFA